MKEEMTKILAIILLTTNNLRCDINIGNYAQRFALQENIEKIRKLHNIDMEDIVSYYNK